MTRYPVQPIDWIFVKSYGFFSRIWEKILEKYK